MPKSCTEARSQGTGEKWWKTNKRSVLESQGGDYSVTAGKEAGYDHICIFNFRIFRAVVLNWKQSAPRNMRQCLQTLILGCHGILGYHGCRRADVTTGISWVQTGM